MTITQRRTGVNRNILKGWELSFYYEKCQKPGQARTKCR